MPRDDVRHLTRHWLPALLGATAVALGRRVYWSHDIVPSLVAHEMVHVRQWREHGTVRFLARYLGDYARGRMRGLGHCDAYLAIEFEREARAAEGS